MSNDFVNYLARQAAVGREKFGPGERRLGVIEHIKQELEEINDAETQEEVCVEWADVCILGMDGLLRAVREGLRERLKDEGEGPNVVNGVIVGFSGEPTNDYVAVCAMNMIVGKQQKNELRDFGDWRGMPEDVAINHKAGDHD